MRKLVKWLCFFLSAAMVVTVLYFALAFLGNPVSFLLTHRSAKRYMAENYANTDFKTSAVGYNFKTGSYYIKVSSPTSQDSHFTVYFDGWGRYWYDTYESVTDLTNTISRLDNEYRKLVKTKMYEGNGTINCRLTIGELRVAGIYEIHTYTTDDGTTEYYTLDKDYGLDRAALEIDGQYDIRELAQTCGHISLNVHEEEVSVQRVAELLLEIRDYLDENNIPFYAISLDLFEPRNENDQLIGDPISVYDFLYSDIYPENLIDRVQENWDAVEKHHAIQDAENAKFLESLSDHQTAN